MSEEELRMLDAEVHGEVMGAKWFRVRYDGRDQSEWEIDNTRLLSANVAARYPNKGWSVQAISPDEGLAAFLAENPKAYQQRVVLNIPRYSTDIDAAWCMEEEIQRRGLVAEYGSCLIGLVPRGDITANAFAMAHASPELRCRAALAAVRAAQP